MPKRHAAGKCAASSCCCGPVTERVDEFTSLWSCFVGQPNAYNPSNPGASTSYSGISSGWAVTGGQLVYSRPASVPNQDPLVIDAVRLAVPYSTEFILEIAELNLVSGDQAALSLHMFDGADGTSPHIRSIANVGAPGFPVGATIAIPGDSQTLLYSSPITTFPVTVWYKVQVDADGIRQWLWYDGVKPTAGPPTNTWGTKKLGTPGALTGTRKRYWSLDVGPDGSGARANFAKFNRLEVREWDHTSMTMPDPDNP